MKGAGGSAGAVRPGERPIYSVPSVSTKNSPVSNPATDPCWIHSLEI